MRRLSIVVAAAALLAGCATAPVSEPKKRLASAPDMAAEAEAALAAGRSDKAVELFTAISRAQPLDKQPWLRMAQIQFDGAQYGPAIASAQEALARDANDTLAYSILAVSGLRVASRALADLTRKNNLQGSVRSEAQELAKLLRTTLGEDVLVAGRPGARKEAPPRKAQPQPAQPARQSADANPFDVLR